MVRHGLVHKDVSKKLASWFEPVRDPSHKRAIVLHVLKHLYAHDTVILPRGCELDYVGCNDLDG